MKRVRQPELMDDPALGPAAHEHALASLNWTNRVLGAHRRLYGHLAELGDPERISLADFGAGGGGLLGHIIKRRGGTPEHGQDRRPAEHGRDHRAASNGQDAFPPILLGVDASPFALACARGWQGPELKCAVADVRRVPLADGSVDVVTCQLLLHHFDEPDVVAILREAARVARRGILIADLSRSGPALVLTWLTTRLVSRSKVFHQDGPRSVRAAYRPREMARLAEQAGLRGARVKSVFPFRWVLVWKK